MSVSQVSSSRSVSPLHTPTSAEFGGMLQVLLRICTPTPHVALHLLHSDHGVGPGVGSS